VESAPAPSRVVAALASAVAGSAARAWPAVGAASVAALLFAGAMVLDAKTGGPPAPPGSGKTQPPAPSSARLDAFGDPLPDDAVVRLGTIRFNHGDGLSALLYAPDGKSIVSVGNGVTRVWNAETGAEVRQFSITLATWQDRVALSPDGTALILAPDERQAGGDSLVTYELVTGKELRKVRLRADRSPKLTYCPNALSPDGRLAVAPATGALHVFAAESGKELSTLSCPGEEVQAIALAGPDRIVTANKKGVIEVWEARTGKRERSFAHDGPAAVMVASPDGKLLATIGHPTHGIDKFLDRDVVQVWDLTEGKLLQRLAARPQSWYMRLAFAADSRTLITSSADRDTGTITVWDARSGERRRELAGQGSALAVSPNGKRLVVGNLPGPFDVWDSASGRRILPDEPRYSRAPAVHLSPDGDRLTTIGYTAISVWDGTTGRRTRSFEVPLLNAAGPWRALSHDGRRALTLSDDGKRSTLHVWGVASGHEEHRLPLPVEGHAVTITFAPDGSRFAVRVPGKDGATIRVHDVQSGKAVSSIRDAKAGGPGHLFMPADGRTVVVAGRRVVGYSLADGSEQFAYRIDPASNSPPGQLARVAGIVLDEPLAWREFALSPDGTLGCCVLPGVFGGPRVADRLLLFDGRTGKVLRRWSDSGKPGRGLEELRFSPDGRLIATSDGHDVHVWEAATGKRVRTFGGHRNEIEALAFSANGRRLASACWDSTVLVWDLSAPPKGEPADWWGDLRADDAATAYAAVWRLADAPDDSTLPLLRKHLRPAPADFAEKVRKAVADLDSNAFAVRERAFQSLADRGHEATPALRAALDQKPSAEARQRIEQLLEKVVGPPSSGELLRTSRALAVLERKGTPEAKRLLQELADGAPGAWLSEEAKSALRRLDRK
jgi:WD40 repeat protein